MVNPTKKEEQPKEVEKKFVTDRAHAMGQTEVKEDAKESEKADPRKSRLIELTRNEYRNPAEETERTALAAEYPDFDAKKVGR